MDFLDSTIFTTLEEGRIANLDLIEGIKQISAKLRLSIQEVIARYQRQLSATIYPRLPISAQLTVGKLIFDRYVSQNKIEQARQRLRQVGDHQPRLRPPVELSADPDTVIRRSAEASHRSEEDLRSHLTISLVGEEIPEISRLYADGVEPSAIGLTAFALLCMIEDRNSIRSIEDSLVLRLTESPI